MHAWFGWIAPIGVPKIILEKSTAEPNAVGQEPDLRKRLDTFTVEFSGLSGQAFADFARKERETLAPIIEKAKHQAELGPDGHASPIWCPTKAIGNRANRHHYAYRRAAQR